MLTYLTRLTTHSESVRSAVCVYSATHVGWISWYTRGHITGSRLQAPAWEVSARADNAVQALLAGTSR